MCKSVKTRIAIAQRQFKMAVQKFSTGSKNDSISIDGSFQCWVRLHFTRHTNYVYEICQYRTLMTLRSHEQRQLTTAGRGMIGGEVQTKKWMASDSVRSLGPRKFANRTKNKHTIMYVNNMLYTPIKQVFPPHLET